MSRINSIMSNNDGFSPCVLSQPPYPPSGISSMRFDPSYLIPISEFITGFTTSSQVHHKNLQHVPLADKELGVHKVTSRTTHNLVKPPPTSASNAPALAWEAVYPKGSINPSATIPGGFEFYLSGPTNFSQSLETASEAIFSYRMMLQDGWEWVKGGKLPGAFGGVGDLSYSCSGGRQEQRDQCFDLRAMWRSQSVGELYTYLPQTPENSKQLSSVPPQSIENPDYGFSVGRGSFSLGRAVGEWMAIAFRMKLNEPGSDNGEVQVWIDGVSVINVCGLNLRMSNEGRIKGMHLSTFFGGHEDDWASPKEQKAWFADITGAILA